MEVQFDEAVHAHDDGGVLPVGIIDFIGDHPNALCVVDDRARWFGAVGYRPLHDDAESIGKCAVLKWPG